VPPRKQKVTANSPPKHTPVEARKDKAAAARTLWVPAVNNHSGFGRWAFIEITDPWDAKAPIRALVEGEMIHDSRRDTTQRG
jgi:hypothetical protein